MDDLGFHVGEWSCTADNVADVFNKENLLQEKPDHSGDEEKHDQHDAYPFCDADGSASAVSAVGWRVLRLLARFHRSSVGAHLPPMQIKPGHRPREATAPRENHGWTALATSAVVNSSPPTRAATRL
jgi:hypothetical protein